MGFSAGGNLAVLSSTAFNARSYEPVDASDQASSRPDFAIPVYPGHLTLEHKNKKPREVAARELNPDIVISPQVPPTLLVHAKDDTVAPVHYPEVYARTLSKPLLALKPTMSEPGGNPLGITKSTPE